MLEVILGGAALVAIIKGISSSGSSNSYSRSSTPGTIDGDTWNDDYPDYDPCDYVNDSCDPDDYID